MKLYSYSASTPCRAVVQFMLENGIDAGTQPIDLNAGEHYAEAYTRINPSRLVPMLEDGDFRLTESATILRYLAQTIDSPAYPRELKQRAKVDELLDWFNSNLYRDWGYRFVYPQVFPFMKYTDPAAQAAVLETGRQKSRAWLQVLNDHWLQPKRKYLRGEDVTIADYFGVALVTIGEMIHCDLKEFPNVIRWIEAMKARPGYAEAAKDFDAFCASMKDEAFTSL